MGYGQKFLEKAAKLSPLDETILATSSLPEMKKFCFHCGDNMESETCRSCGFSKATEVETEEGIEITYVPEDQDASPAIHQVNFWSSIALIFGIFLVISFLVVLFIASSPK